MDRPVHPEDQSDAFDPVPIVHLLKHPQFFLDVSTFILVSERYIKLNYAEDPYHEILEGLLKKGSTHVYLKSDDLAELIHKFQQKMNANSDKKFDDVVTRELQLSENETMIMLSQTFIKRFGATPEILNMIEVSNKKVLSLLSKSKNILSLLQKFRKNSSEEYFKISFCNYICSVILHHFPWSSPQILEKLMLASTICDLSLSIGELESLKLYEAGKGPLLDEVKNHPNKVLELLKDDRNHLSLEVATIIQQHHERPDGKGFPAGLNHNRINQLSAIFIVAQKFGDLVCESDMANVNYLALAEKVQETYHGGFFSKASKALIAEVGKIDPY